ncbi:hypothetical protein E8E14_014093 [Neopestalotiopsis sp. 37M]|nr:hypothetical protein E8E14_014093 [Neopestalotiopsis sp. 37M]
MPHATHPSSDEDYANARLRLVGTRVVEPSESIRSNTYEGADGLIRKRPLRDVPEFCKNEAATTFELFYDLWFVANLSVFSSVHEISTIKSLQSFIGYYILLWTTWLITTLYDVRFTSDSVLERCCKAVHLGVMVGFAEIGTAFDPDHQIQAIFRAMSFFLMFSRLALTLQYGLVAWQIRKYAVGSRHMLLTAATHFVAAAIYCGISFRYAEGKNSRVYIVWYIVSITEMALHLSWSQMSEILTFVGTHMGERLNLLTLIVLGEGAIILAKNVTLVVKDTYLKDAKLLYWSSSLIGIVTSSAALIYIIFQLYFDWMHEEDSMSTRHQVWWAALHLPFHIALVLLLEGSNQFVIWARVQEGVAVAISKLVSVRDKLPDEPTSAQVSQALGDVVKPFITKYQPADVLEAWQGVNKSLTDIAELPNSLWTEEHSSADEADYEHWMSELQELLYTMVNAVYNAFGIEAEVETETGAATEEHGEYVQTQATHAIGLRFSLVFVYAFACAGIVLMFLTIMHIISKRKGWTIFNVARTAVCLALATGLSLVPLLTRNEAYMETFMGSSWMLPSILLCYFTVLVLTHVPHPPVAGTVRRIVGGGRQRGAYREVEEHKVGLKDGGSQVTEVALRDMTPPPRDIPFEHEHAMQNTQLLQPHHHDEATLVGETRHPAAGDYLSRGEMEMPQSPEPEQRGVFRNHGNRASYMSTGSDFDDVIDYEAQNGNHRDAGLAEWERRH